jgi:hypothetical protein
MAFAASVYEHREDIPGLEMIGLVHNEVILLVQYRQHFSMDQQDSSDMSATSYAYYAFYSVSAAGVLNMSRGLNRVAPMRGEKTAGGSSLDQSGYERVRILGDK